MKQILDLFLHLDKHLNQIITDYGTTTYLILFAIVFVETGLVIMPFLPGDSLLFAAGVFAGSGSLSLPILYFLLIAAALTGDNVNYVVGKFLGPKLFHSNKGRLLNRQHLDRTHAFFEKYGGKAIILARFVPIVRTCMPFVAGIGTMTYRRFLAYSVAGAVLWVSSCVLAGYFFGGIPVVRKNFALVAVAIVFISVLPAVVEIVKRRREVAHAK